MDNQRLLIWAFFGLMGWITYQTWVQDYAPQPIAQAQQQIEQPDLIAPSADDELPELTAASDDSLDAPLPANEEQRAVSAAVASAPTIRVTTDVLDITISTEGGTLQSASLLGYPIAKDQPDTLIQLLTTDNDNFGAIQTGLRIIGDGEEPNHRALFSSDATTYELGSSDELIVPLTWRSSDGVTVEKRFRFTRGGYAIGIEHGEVAEDLANINKHGLCVCVCSIGGRIGERVLP